MLTIRQVVAQINSSIASLVELGLADRQSVAFERAGQVSEVTFRGASQTSVALRQRSYADIYAQLIQAGAYNARMLDGALIQLMYTFSHGSLTRHRLAFFPSPDLEEYQSSPEAYWNDEIFAYVVSKHIVASPIRFDFDVSDARHKAVCHPKSHLTLGQYDHCRIPVSSPLSPIQFFGFIARNFYRTNLDSYTQHMPGARLSFGDSILESERAVMHVVVPG